MTRRGRTAGRRGEAAARRRAGMPALAKQAPAGATTACCACVGDFCIPSASSTARCALKDGTLTWRRLLLRWLRAGGMEGFAPRAYRAGPPPSGQRMDLQRSEQTRSIGVPQRHLYANAYSLLRLARTRCWDAPPIPSSPCPSPAILTFSTGLPAFRGRFILPHYRIIAAVAHIRMPDAAPRWYRRVGRPGRFSRCRGLFLHRASGLPSRRACQVRSPASATLDHRARTATRYLNSGLYAAWRCLRVTSAVRALP